MSPWLRRGPASAAGRERGSGLRANTGAHRFGWRSGVDEATGALVGFIGLNLVGGGTASIICTLEIEIQCIGAPGRSSGKVERQRAAPDHGVEEIDGESIVRPCTEVRYVLYVL